MNALRFRLLWLAGNLAMICLISVKPLQAQIATDSTLSTQVTTVNKINFTIEGGSRVGNNLFHSFSEFSVPTGGSAFFNNALDVTNIINRVTGGNISKIDGILKANGTANLFLLNPNGIIFGNNASLNIGGSLVAASANSLKFADGSELNTTISSTPPLLTISVPVGLQFGANPGAIVNSARGTVINPSSGQPIGLQVKSGQTLALVGGEVDLVSGNLTVPGGRIELGSVAGNSLVNLTPSNQGLALSYGQTQNFQDLHISGGSIIDVTNFNPTAGSGDVNLQGRQIILTEGSQISSFTIGSISSGSISLTASDLVELNGTGIRIDPRGNVQVTTNLTTTTVGNGNAGDLNINTQRLIVQDGAGIFTNSLSMGNKVSLGRAGNLKIVAPDSVEISGISPQLGESQLSVESKTNGNAGTLAITTGQLMLLNGGVITASTSGVGQGGTVTIVATNLLDVAGASFDSKNKLLNSRITATSQGIGDAGNLIIATGILKVRDRGEIAVSGTQAGGAGNLDIQAQELELNNLGTISAETAAGNRGSINLNVDHIQLRHNSSITTSATNTASGGNININTETLAALENSKIIANAIAGSGGNIQISTQGIFLSPDSNITASSQFGVSGTITINSPEVNPSSGLIVLPDTVQDPTHQIVVGCAANQGNSLTVTGLGGLPEDATAMIRGQTIWRDWQDFSASENARPQKFSQNSRFLVPQQPHQLVEATGWVIAPGGKIQLTTYTANLTGDSAWLKSLQCKGI